MFHLNDRFLLSQKLSIVHSDPSLEMFWIATLAIFSVTNKNTLEFNADPCFKKFTRKIQILRNRYNFKRDHCCNAIKITHINKKYFSIFCYQHKSSAVNHHKYLLMFIITTRRTFFKNSFSIFTCLFIFSSSKWTQKASIENRSTTRKIIHHGDNKFMKTFCLWKDKFFKLFASLSQVQYAKFIRNFSLHNSFEINICCNLHFMRPLKEGEKCVWTAKFKSFRRFQVQFFLARRSIFFPFRSPTETIENNSFQYVANWIGF